MNYRDFYRKEQSLSGGKGDDLSSSQVDPVELSKGVKVEMEHTKDPKIAQEIALDHLAEDPKYYSRLQTANLTDELPKGRLGGLEPLQPNAVLDTTRLKGVSIAKIINPAAALGGISPQVCPASTGGSTTSAPGDKEPITAAGKVDSSIASKTVGGSVVPGEGQSQGGPNTKGNIAGTPDNPQGMGTAQGQKSDGPNHQGTIAGTPKLGASGIGGGGQPNPLAKASHTEDPLEDEEEDEAEDVVINLKESIRKIVQETLEEMGEAAYKVVPKTSARVAADDHAHRVQCCPKMTEEAGEMLDVEKIADVEVDGVDRRDYPDFVDAYVTSAVYPIVDKPKGAISNPEDWRELTEDELDWLNNEHPEIAQQAAAEHMMTGGGMHENLKEGAQYKVNKGQTQIERPGTINRSREIQKNPTVSEVAPPGFGPGKKHADIYKKVKNQYPGDDKKAYATMWKISKQIDEFVEKTLQEAGAQYKVNAGNSYAEKTGEVNRAREIQEDPTVSEQSFKKGERSYRTFKDSPQFPEDSTFNPEVSEGKKKNTNNRRSANPKRNNLAKRFKKGGDLHKEALDINKKIHEGASLSVSERELIKEIIVRKAIGIEETSDRQRMLESFITDMVKYRGKDDDAQDLTQSIIATSEAKMGVKNLNESIIKKCVEGLMKKYPAKY